MTDTHWRAAIMNLPKDDRLPAALDMLSDVMGDDDQEREHWRLALKIRPQAATVLTMLLARPGRVVRKDVAHMALDATGSEAISRDLVNVAVHHIRRALERKGIHGAIRSHYGTGFSICPVAAGELLAL